MTCSPFDYFLWAAFGFSLCGALLSAADLLVIVGRRLKARSNDGSPLRTIDGQMNEGNPHE